MKANQLVWVILLFLLGCASTPEQRAANEHRREAELKTEQEKRQAEETKKQRKEQDRIIQKYAAFSTEQLRVKQASLDRQIAGGNWVHGLIAKASYDGKVKEDDEIAMEIVRREESVRSERIHRRDNNSTPISESDPSASGTGFFITEDGFLVTNEHVVRDAAQVRLVTSTGLISATVVRLDAANDFALLKAEGQFAPLPVASSRTAHLGGMVATVGFPNIGMQGFAPKFARGEIASLSGAADDARYFQISVPVQPGNSGGALVDEHGNVIGIVSAKLDASAALASSGALPENVNYAVKSSFLLSFLESVPAVSAKLKEPITADRKFEDVVKSAQDAAVLVLVY
jgi:S1-C subfamily serine protease